STKDEIKGRATRLAAAMIESGIQAEVIDGDSVIGGGSVPGSRLPTALIEISAENMAAEALDGELRSGSPPVIGRIEDGCCVLDLRTVDPDDEPVLLEAIRAAVSRVEK